MLKKDVHIGSIIKRIIKEKKVKVTAISRELGFDRKRVYSIFDSKSIDTDLLVRFSKILNYNFFLEYHSENLPFMDNIVVAEMDNSKMALISSEQSIKIIKQFKSV